MESTARMAWLSLRNKKKLNWKIAAGKSNLFKFFQSWKDLRLTWNASEYGGIQSIVLPSYYLWDADLHLNSVTLESSGSSFVGTSNVRVGFDGMNNVTERLNFKSFCEMNFRNWPYDTHHCSIVLGKMVAHEDDAIQIQTLPADWVIIFNDPIWQTVRQSKINFFRNGSVKAVCGKLLVHQWKNIKTQWKWQMKNSPEFSTES